MRKFQVLAVLAMMGLLAAVAYAATRTVSATGRYYVIDKGDKSKSTYSGKKLKEYDGKNICAVSKGLLAKSDLTQEDVRKEKVLVSIKKGRYVLSSRLAVDLNPSNSSIAEPYFEEKEKAAIKQFEEKCNGKDIEVTLKKK